MKRFSAERPRFELGRPFRSLHAFQACLLSHSSTSPWLISRSEKGFLTNGIANIGIFLNIEKSLSVSGGNFRAAIRAAFRAAIRLAFQVAIREPNPGKPCPPLRIGWFSGHQDPGNRARSSASGGYPDTKSRETVPAAPPLTMVWKGRRVFGGLGRGGLFSGRRALERAAFQPFDVAIDPEQFPGNIDALRAVRDALLAGCAV